MTLSAQPDPIPQMAKDSPTTEGERPQAFDPAAGLQEPRDRIPGSLRQRFGQLRDPLLTRIGETPRQTSMLFSAQMGSAAAGFLVATIQMHWMDPGEIGRYAFCLTLIVISGLLFEFGLFPAGGRVLALLSDRESEKKALGAFLLLTAADGVVFAMFVAVVASPAARIFKQDVRWLLVGAAAPAVFLPVQRLVEESCQGLNRIRLLSEYRLMTAGLQLASTAVLGATHKLTAGSALLAYLVSIGPSAAITIVRLGVSFTGSSRFRKQTVREIRGYGLNAYIAAMTGTASGRLDNLVITYLAGAEPLGLYFSAQRFSAPLSTMARALAITRFRVFARLAEVPRRILTWNAATMTTGALLVALGGPLAIKILFPRYAAAAPLFVPFAALNLFMGLFQPYNMFLASHGRGAELRNIAVAVTLGTVIALFVCVPPYGILGAAWAGAIAMLLDYLLHLYYYHKLTAELQGTRAVPRKPDPNQVALGDQAAQTSPLTVRLNHVPLADEGRGESPNLSHDENHDSAGVSLALLLDLSNDPAAAASWAMDNLNPHETRVIGKADLKWGSKAGALKLVRLMRPNVFAVFCSDLTTQSATSSIQIFGALAGAKTVILADPSGRVNRCSRYRALLLGPLALASQLIIGYILLAPLSWLFALALETLSPVIKSNAATTADRETIADRPTRRRAAEPAYRRAGPRTRKRSGLYLLATPASASVAGGMTTHVSGFTGGAAAEGHHLDFITSAELPAIGPASQVHVVPLSRALGATRALFELWNSIIYTLGVVRIYRQRGRERGWEFIYQRYNRFNCAGVLLSTLTGLPLLLEYNGSEVWVGRNWDPVGLMPLLKRLEHVNQRRADLIVVVSTEESRNLQALGVPADKIVVNPNAVDVGEFHPECGGAELRDELGLAGKIVVGFVGSFGPWHGTDVLAGAAILTGTDSGCHFLFVGAGDLRPKTESIIVKGNCGAIASFVGRIPHRSIPRYLDACDILVAPHVPTPDGNPYFGSPTKLFEYLAMARPVVASRLGQMSEILVDGETAVLVEPGDPAALADAILRLSKDEALRRRLGVNGRALVISGHTWQGNAARVFQALDRLLDRQSESNLNSDIAAGGASRA
jgi:glycosyltransferase involved in cell wall biosynthesis/O-antigen/teichoic acid export membrane protein